MFGVSSTQAARPSFSFEQPQARSRDGAATMARGNGGASDKIASELQKNANAILTLDVLDQPPAYAEASRAMAAISDANKRVARGQVEAAWCHRVSLCVSKGIFYIHGAVQSLRASEDLAKQLVHLGVLSPPGGLGFLTAKNSMLIRCDPQKSELSSLRLRGQPVDAPTLLRVRAILTDIHDMQSAVYAWAPKAMRDSKELSQIVGRQRAARQGMSQATADGGHMGWLKHVIIAPHTAAEKIARRGLHYQPHLGGSVERGRLLLAAACEELSLRHKTESQTFGMAFGSYDVIFADPTGTR